MIGDTQLHEAWVALLREQPALVAQLLQRAGAVEHAPPATVAAIVGSEVIKARPDSLRADLVVRFGDAEVPERAVVVEVQLRVESAKRFTWPAYVAGVRAERVDESRRGDYYAWVLDSLDEAVVQRLEDEMEQGRHRELTSLERHFIAKGEAKGLAEAKRQDILRVLAARGVEVPAHVRRRILACDETAVLDEWLVRAVTAARAADVVDG